MNARVKRVQDLLAALGIDRARIEILSSASTKDGNAYAALTAEFSERLKKIGVGTK